MAVSCGMWTGTFANLTFESARAFPELDYELEYGEHTGSPSLSKMHAHTWASGHPALLMALSWVQ